MNNQTDSILAGLGITPDQTDQHKTIMSALIANETDPDMKKLLEGMEPVENMPGYYRNPTNGFLLKYNPNADTAPTLMKESLPLQGTSKVINQGGIQ
jgi:hypothetical protein